MSETCSRHSMKSLYRVRKKAFKTPLTALGPQKKGGLFRRLNELKRQRAELDRQIKMIEALPSPILYRDAPNTSSEEWAVWNNEVGYIVDSNSVDTRSSCDMDVNVGGVD